MYLCTLVLTTNCKVMTEQQQHQLIMAPPSPSSVSVNYYYHSSASALKLKSTSNYTSSSESTVRNEDLCGNCVRMTNFLHLRSRAVDAVTNDINLAKEDVDTNPNYARTSKGSSVDNQKTPLLCQKKNSRPPRYPSPPSEDVQSEKLARTRTPTPTPPQKGSDDLAITIITNEPQSAGLSMPMLCRSPTETLHHSHLISTANIGTPLLSLNSRKARNFETMMPPVPQIHLKMRHGKDTTYHHIDRDPEVMDPRQTITGFVPLQHDSGRKMAARELKFEERK